MILRYFLTDELFSYNQRFYSSRLYTSLSTLALWHSLLYTKCGLIRSFENQTNGYHQLFITTDI